MIFGSNTMYDWITVDSAIVSQQLTPTKPCVICQSIIPACTHYYILLDLRSYAACNMRCTGTPAVTDQEVPKSSMCSLLKVCCIPFGMLFAAEIEPHMYTYSHEYIIYIARLNRKPIPDLETASGFGFLFFCRLKTIAHKVFFGSRFASFFTFFSALRVE